jgi:multidrug efflux system membrane fusion protein
MNTRLLFGSLVLIFAIGCSGRGPGTTEQPGPPEVTVAHPAVAKLTETTDLTGTLDAAEYVQVRPRVSGYIQDVDFKDGEEVKAGKVLFLIDPAPYEATLKQATAQLTRYKAELKLAESEVARNKRLVDQGGIAREEYEQSIAKLGMASAGIEGSNAAIARAKLDLDWTKVTAPIDGKTDRAYLTKGNVVTGGLSQGTIMTSIVSTDKIYAYFDVSDQVFDYYLKQIKEGRLVQNGKGAEGVEVFISLPGDGGLYPHRGVMDFAGNRFSPSTGSLQIRAVIDHPTKEMVGGRQVKARVPISKPYDAILVPEEVIGTDQGAKFVYVVDSSNKAHTRPIKVGPMAYGLRVVTEGLNKDDQVVIKGQQRIRADTVVAPMESKEGIRVVKPQEPEKKEPEKKDTNGKDAGKKDAGSKDAEKKDGDKKDADKKDSDKKDADKKDADKKDSGKDTSGKDK